MTEVRPCTNCGAPARSDGSDYDGLVCEQWPLCDDPRAVLANRLRNLTQELRTRGIRRDIWGTIREQAQGAKSVKELDDYLDSMEANHSRYL